MFSFLPFLVFIDGKSPIKQLFRLLETGDMFSDYSIDCVIEGFFFNDVDTDQMILWLNSVKSVRDVSIEFSDSQLVFSSNVMLEHGNWFIPAILE